MNDSPAAESIVTCQQLRIVSDDGQLRAVLAYRGGMPYFQMYDAEGRVRIETQVDPNGRPTFALWDNQGAPAISIGMAEDNSRGITIHGERGLPVLTLNVTEENEVQISTLPFRSEDAE